MANVHDFVLAPREFTTRVGGLFLFVPDLVRFGGDALATGAKLPGSGMIPAGHALRASLALKLWSIERKSHVMALVADEGLALFCGLNTMPKKSFLSEYSSRITPHNVSRLLALWHTKLSGETLVTGQSLNLDFRSVPYFGEHPLVESHYLSKRSRRQPSILTFLAQDADSQVFCYSNADIRKGEEAEEVFRFIAFWKRQHGSVPQHLVFDSKLTTYKNLVRLTSIGYTEGFYRRPRIDKDCLEQHSEGLVCLAAGLNAQHPLGEGQDAALAYKLQVGGEVDFEQAGSGKRARDITGETEERGGNVVNRRRWKLGTPYAAPDRGHDHRLAYQDAGQVDQVGRLFDDLAAAARRVLPPRWRGCLVVPGCQHHLWRPFREQLAHHRQGIQRAELVADSDHQGPANQMRSNTFGRGQVRRERLFDEEVDAPLDQRFLQRSMPVGRDTYPDCVRAFGVQQVVQLRVAASAPLACLDVSTRAISGKMPDKLQARDVAQHAQVARGDAPRANHGDPHPPGPSTDSRRTSCGASVPPVRRNSTSITWRYRESPGQPEARHADVRRAARTCWARHPPVRDG